jgi:putative ABC transport system permease protein
MIFILAWKNIWRNKLRSSIIISAITLGLVGGIFSLAFSNGMLVQMINATIRSETADVQIHDKDFKTNFDLTKSIPSAQKLAEEIEKISDFKSISSRVVISGMANSASNGLGVMITGVNPDEEKKVSDIHSKIIMGKYFSSRHNSAVVGSMLLKKLNLKLYSKIILTFQDMKGEITTAAFRVVGIYQTNNSQFDQSTVFVNQNDLRREASLTPEYINEMAIRIKSEDNLKQAKAEIEKVIAQSSQYKYLEVETWNELKPSLKIMQSYTDQFTFIFILIILVALSFGVINTMLMAIMERTHEIGMLLAIGMRRSKVFLMIMYETVMLSLVGAVLGVILAFILNLITGHTGIDLSVFSDGFRAYGYNPIVIPQMEPVFYYMILLMVFFVSILAAIYPAVKAIRLKPAVAIRHVA